MVFPTSERVVIDLSARSPIRLGLWPLTSPLFEVDDGHTQRLEVHMQAKPGDLLKISGHRVGEPARHAEILEVRGEKGHPPYFVRWPDGHESVVYPGPDMQVEHTSHKGAKS